MKILAECPVCSESEARPVSLRLDENGVALGTCQADHVFAVVSEHEPYEILFDAGAIALIDDYPREAVLDFIGARESFIEYFNRINTRLRWDAGFPPEGGWVETMRDEYENTWKRVSRQSERQLGAFCYLHLLFFGVAYVIDEAAVALRNRVVHQGYVPSNDEAKELGERVWVDLGDLRSNLGEIGNIAPWDDYLESQEKKVQALNAPGTPILTLDHCLMLNWGLKMGFAERLMLMRTHWRQAHYGRI